MSNKKMHRTHKGHLIDMDALRMMNATSVAVGNGKMNARGDTLGKGGLIIKTREQKSNEYYQEQVKTQTQMNESPAVYKPQIDEVQEDFEFTKQSKPRKRKGE